MAERTGKSVKPRLGQTSGPPDLPSRRVAIVDNYDSYTYNLAQLIARLTGVEPGVIPVDLFDKSTESDYAAIVVSPGPGHPATEPAFAVCLDLIRNRRGQS